LGDDEGYFVIIRKLKTGSYWRNSSLMCMNVNLICFDSKFGWKSVATSQIV